MSERERFLIGEKVVDKDVNKGKVIICNDARIIVKGEDGTDREYATDNYGLVSLFEPSQTFEKNVRVVDRVNDRLGTFKKEDAKHYHVLMDDSGEVEVFSRYHPLLDRFEPYNYYSMDTVFAPTIDTKATIRDAAIKLFKAGGEPVKIYASPLMYADIMTETKFKDYVKFLVGLKNFKCEPHLPYGTMVISVSEISTFPPDENTPDYIYVPRR